MTDETTAREALRALGINPTKTLIRTWLQAAQAEELPEKAWTNVPRQPPGSSPTGRSSAVADPKPLYPRGYSKSQLEPVLRAHGTLVRQTGRRKRGRPRIVASWFEQLAAAMADGTSLPVALQRIGVILDKSQIRALYRNGEFRRKYLECRKSYCDAKGT